MHMHNTDCVSDLDIVSVYSIELAYHHVYQVETNLIPLPFIKRLYLKSCLL